MNEENKVLDEGMETEIDNDDWDIDLDDVEDTADDFDLDLDDEDTEDADEENPSEEAETEEQEESETEDEADDTKPEADQSFELKYLGEVKTVSKDEAVVLAQKGMDYDRLRGKYDTLATEKEAFKESADFIAELAKEQGISPNEFIDQTKAAILAKKEGIDASVAMEKVKLQRKEKELAEKEAKLTSANAEKEQKKAEEEKRQQDIKEFLATFPDVKPTDIPREVWDSVAKGDSLVAAYLKHENAKLKYEREAALKNKENRKKDTGSRKSAGRKSSIESLIDQYWNDD